MRSSLRSLPGVDRLVTALCASYRRKLATTLLVVLVIIAAVTVGLYFQLGGLLGQTVERSMTAAANAEADELNEWSDRNRLVTRVLSDDAVYGAGETEGIRRYLRTRSEDWTEASIESAYVIDRRNLTVEVSSTQRLEGTAVGDLPWEEEFAFRDFGDVRITEPHRAGNGTIVVGYISPIRRDPGHLLVVTFDAASVFGRFEHPVDGGFTRVVDSNGTVMFADDRSAALQQYQDRVLRAPAVSEGLRGESGFTAEPSYEEATPGRGEYVVAYAPVAGTDWVVVEHAPADEAYAILRRAQTWIGIVGVIALAGLVGVITVLGADVTGALSQLRRRAEQIEVGNYDVTFDTDRPDEFGDLNRTLATTRDTLRRRFEELRETKVALEETNAALEDRSAMVSVLNRVLRHNVRNDVNVIAGRAEHVAQRVEDESVRAEIEKIQQVAWELAALSNRTQRINHLLSEERTEQTTTDVVGRLRDAVESIRSSAPDAEVDLTVVDVTATRVDCVATLPAAITDAVEQIIDYNDGHVRVEITADGDTAEDGTGSLLIVIADDGRGLPDLDVRAVTRGEETPLDHAQGLALWSLEWTVNKSDGELLVDTDDATIEIRLPLTDAPRRQRP